MTSHTARAERGTDALEPRPEGAAADLGLYPIVTRSTARPLYTRFTIILSGCVSEVTTAYHPTRTIHIAPRKIQMIGYTAGPATP